MSPLFLLIPTTLILSSLLLFFFTLKPLRFHRRCHPPLPPGPRGWPILGNLPQLGTHPHQTLAKLSALYGPLLHLRLGSTNAIVVSSADVATSILKTHDTNFSSRPHNTGATYMAYKAQDIAWAPYGPRWRALRKVCGLHLFSGKALDGYRHVRESEASAMVQGIMKAVAQDGGPVEVAHWLNSCTVNTLSRIMVGKSGGDGEKVREFKEMTVELTTLAGEFVLGDFVPFLRWFDVGGVVRKMKEAGKRIDRFMDRIIEENRNDFESKKSDFLSVLLELKEKDEVEGGKLSDDEIKGILTDMFVAGTDTSASTVEWALAELIRHPNILKKAQEELDSIVGHNRIVNESDLANLSFLQAIIKETFRLHPSTPLSLPRIASNDCEINGYLIPKGATVLTNVWAISRDPISWDMPFEFEPGRFVPGSVHENVDVRGNDFSIIPSGSGRRICVGMSLGLRMVNLMLATLIHAFEWTLEMDQNPEKLNMDEVYGITLQRAVPLAICPHPRLASHVYCSIDALF